MKNLYVNQYGQRYYASTVKDLRQQVRNGGSRVSRMYIDGPKGETLHIGYVIGGEWLTKYAPVVKKV